MHVRAHAYTRCSYLYSPLLPLQCVSYATTVTCRAPPGLHNFSINYRYYRYLQSAAWPAELLNQAPLDDARHQLQDRPCIRYKIL
jgi:hypothetical protein